MTVTSTSPHAATQKPIPSHSWATAGLATVSGWVGVWFAAMAAMLDYPTSVTLLAPRGLARDQLGMPLSDFEYWWARYGDWLFELILALGIITALALTWWSLRARRPRACLVLAALTCALSATPLIINTSRITT